MMQIRRPADLKFEHRSVAVAGRKKFLRRVLWYAITGFLFIISSLFLGALGYRILENISWVDAFYNASMILTGMGPAIELHTDKSKIFVTLYSIYSGVTFLTAVGVMLAPLFHRVLHKLLAPIEHNQ
ncbi:MAG: hypothetical protein KG003_06935 [Bacteroidetes bacterium]|nr:hypothetical protein [Bacteroidota bacterium]